MEKIMLAWGKGLNFSTHRYSIEAQRDPGNWLIFPRPQTKVHWVYVLFTYDRFQGLKCCFGDFDIGNSGRDFY